MSTTNITVKKLYNTPELNLNLLAGESGLGKKIINSEINRPGLSLTGFFDFFAFDRIQIFGKGEWAYLNSINAEQLEMVSEKFFSYELNSIIFTHGNIPQEIIIQNASKKGIPLFNSNKTTHEFIRLISDFLNKSLAPRTMRHGVLIEVFGLGILLTGKSGVGKSETALELIERGHRLVADDMVEIRRYSENSILGTCSDIIRHHMEIRGLGIVNIKDIFGAGSVREQKYIDLIITIEEWSEESDYDRTGLDEKCEEILGVKIPVLKIPIKPGRNLPIIVETAAMNQRLKKMGNHAAREFNQHISQHMKEKKH
ncbi:MAG: HPr kinase/phosphorylase [Leptospiraceae bacterium]|nr:HPr kinase/phosphorylase [Leptospiraceae bacterium]